MINDIAFFLQSNINDKAGNNWSYTLDILGQFFYLILVTAVVLFLLYYFIKFTSKVRVARRGSNNLEIIESLSVSYQNYIHIVRVGEKYILIGVNKEKVSFLTEIDEKEIKLQEQEDKSNNKFDSYLNKNIGKILKKVEGKQ